MSFSGIQNLRCIGIYLHAFLSGIDTGSYQLSVFNSTIQIRQAPISLISFKKHRVGISICASRAASRIVEPLGASTAMPLILRLIVSIVYSLPHYFL